MSVLRGSCLCGGVQFELLGSFEPRSFCHCTTCKRISGGVGTANGRARSDEIRIIEGELLRTYQPAEGSAKTFCSVCGSNLFGGGWPESEYASVRLPSFETPFEGRPGKHIYTRSVAAWETLPDDGLERHEAGA
ncbi:MAG: GFA family protein [Gaiellaceae bacterium]